MISICEERSRASCVCALCGLLSLRNLQSSCPCYLSYHSPGFYVTSWNLPSLILCLFIFCFLPVEQWFSTVVFFAKKRTFGTVWRHLLRGARGISWVEAKDTTKHLIFHRTPLTIKNYLAQTVNLGNPVLKCKLWGRLAGSVG